MTLAIDNDPEGLIAAARVRQRDRLAPREVRARAVLIAILLASGAGLWLLTPDGQPVAWWWYAVFVGEYALLSYTEFEVGNGAALPTNLVFVPMLFVLPPVAVALVVGAALILSAVPAFLRREMSLARVLSAPANAVFAVGPAAVFAIAGHPHADARGAAILAGAIGAQFICDFGASALLEYLALGTSPRKLVEPFLTTFAIDALVTPLGFLVAIAMRVELLALALPLPVVGLLSLLSRERKERVDSLLELSSAYRGTAFLLGDVVEADDAYTGEHSRQVVELVAAVATEMKLNAREMRLAELTALLHDVGKIRIPNAIINKPGPLDPEERRIIETHTIEGQILLERVGGLLGEVGVLVRSCHERWDGRGYPDGLVGEETPVVARIVACCDAYNAMTTTRSYRAAMTPREALAEVVANTGTQFDPSVVAALVSVTSEGVGRTTASRHLEAVAELAPATAV